jgi:hypothetical protein
MKAITLTTIVGLLSFGGGAFGATTPTSSPEHSSSIDQAQGSTAVPYAVFIGTVTSIRILAGPITAIPIGADTRFVLTVRVSDLLSGTLPKQSGGTVAFLIHSPALLFGAAVDLDHPPRGRFRFDLFRAQGSNGSSDFSLHVSPESSVNVPDSRFGANLATAPGNDLIVTTS